MNLKEKRVLVLCPGNAVTGGPELLHQLVDELRRQGKDAAIAYYPFEQTFQTPKDYRCYDVPQRTYSDDVDQVVIIPEIDTHFLRLIQYGTPCIWWLSIGNYFGYTGQSFKNSLEGYIKAIIYSRRQPIRLMRKTMHLAQSYYAKSFLQRRGLTVQLLTDYLAHEHLTREIDSAPRRDIVVYNPKKGLPVVNRLRASLPHIEFVAVENLSKAEVATLMSSAKIYIDFGHHPGKDRLPREAAMAGCCVITGRRGSAVFDEDVPIQSRYKLRDRSRMLDEEFAALVSEIFADFGTHQREFDGYRAGIRAEKEVFRRQVQTIFGDCAPLSDDPETPLHDRQKPA